MFRVAVPVLLLTAAAAFPADPKAVTDAVNKGAAYLKANYTGGEVDNQRVGAASLVGLALLEAGVDPNTDPALNALVRGVRAEAFGEHKTYGVALAVIFLDRLNDPTDVPLVQLLGCKLLAGQTLSGGWGYDTWQPDAAADAATQAALGNRTPARVRAGPKPTPDTPKPKLHPRVDPVWRRVQAGYRTPGVTGGGDDNSNTQFAIVGLWVAQRRGVPIGAAVRSLEGRFLRSQSPSDSGWSYNGTGGDSTPSMTCAGLLALAAATAYKDDPKSATAPPAAPAAEKKADDDPFYNPPEPGKGGGDPDAPKPEERPEAKNANPFRAAAIERALRQLGRLLKSQTGQGAPPAGAGWGGVDDLYFVWSLERVAVAFGLDTIGDVDWYEWGANRLLASQQPDGSWRGAHGEAVATAFALLFLKKSNFVADMSNKLQGKVKDPGAAELRGSRGGIPGLAAGGSPDSVRAPGSVRRGPAGGSPNVGEVAGPGRAEELFEKLAAASDGEYVTLTASIERSKGGEFTQALVLAAGRFDGKRQYDAREKLARRLTRMTPDTLKRMLEDRDRELRRAAALACGMKDDRVHVRDLITRVTDPDEAVVRAARSALRTLTGQELGPPVNATDEEKGKAFDAWLIWYTTTGRGK